jgi:hypothetical protein
MVGGGSVTGGAVAGGWVAGGVVAGAAVVGVVWRGADLACVVGVVSCAAAGATVVVVVGADVEVVLEDVVELSSVCVSSSPPQAAPNRERPATPSTPTIRRMPVPTSEPGPRFTAST